MQDIKYPKTRLQEHLDDVIESANEVKSWNRYGTSEVSPLAVGFLIGIIFTAIVVIATPLIIASV